MTHIFYLSYLAIPFTLLAMRWLLINFESTNKQNSFFNQIAIVAIAGFGCHIAWGLAINSWPNLSGVALGILLIPVICAAPLKLLLRTSCRRSLLLGAGLPVSWALSYAIIWVSAQSIGTVWQHYPSLLVALFACASSVGLALYRRNTQIMASFNRVTCWLGA